MTITFNPFEFLRFAFIIGWVMMAALTTWGMLFTYCDTGDYVWIAITWILCLGSAAMLFFGK